MGLEIERRFLVKNDKWKNFITKKTYIEQGYLSKNLNDWIVRIRFNGMDFKIALKKHIKNFTNFEFEYLIPQKDGEKILSNLKHIIKKERYSLEVDKKTWILDCFKDKNYPLEIAEIEIKKETEDLNLPSFLSKEITGISIYSNVSLATYPISEWRHEDLITLNESQSKFPHSFIFFLCLRKDLFFIEMYGLYDKEGILRFVDSDKEACLAYAELFELGSTNYCLMDLEDNRNDY